MNVAALLKLSNIDKKYYLNKTQYQHVLKGVDVSFEKGELVALVGESGSGKTTLLNIIGGLDTDYLGSVVVKNQFIREFDEKQIDDYRKKRIGLIFQNYNLITHMTLFENIKIAMDMSDSKEEVKNQRTLELLQLVGLEKHANKYPNQLSGGQKQRVAIARSLANNPSIILADEPTGALDKESAEIVMNILHKIVESGKLVIVVTHSNTVANKCSRVIKIDDGIIVSDEKKFDIKITNEYEKVIMPKPIDKKQLIKLSYRNLKQKLSRTLLVSIAISIGIAAVILILSLSSGLTKYVKDMYEDNLYSNQITAYKDDYSYITSSNFDQLNKLEGISNYIESYYLSALSYSTDSTSNIVSELGAFYENYYPEILYGSFINNDNYIIINEKMALDITEDTIIAAIGKEITMRNSGVEKTFKVSGIFKDYSPNNETPRAYIAKNQLAMLNNSQNQLYVLYVNVKEVSYVTSVLDDLSFIGFNTYQADNQAKQLLGYIDLGTTVLTALAALSLVVSSIMIFVVIYISIIERTKEIGILRSIGARRKDIRYLISYESLIIGFIGGTFGVVLSIIITILTNAFTSLSMEFNLMTYNVLYYILGLVISVLISVVSGILPSVKASNFDPVEALRYE